jgi:solute:Na+ symporter, SSS family
MHLHFLDFVAIGVYFASLFVIGIYFSKRQTSAETYFLAERKMPAFLVGISVVATLVSTNTYLATPGETIKHGIGFFSLTLAYIFVIPTVNRFVIPLLMRLPVTSVYEYVENRFSSATRTLAASIFILTRLIWIGLIVYTASLATTSMTGWSMPLVICVIGISTAFYTTLGGIGAVIWTDFLQFVLLMGGAIFIPLYVAWQTGAGPLAWWDAFSKAGHTTVPVFSFDPLVRITVVGMILESFVWNICTHGADQVAAQRYLTTSSAEAAKRSVWTFSIFNVGLIALLMLCGVSLFYFKFHHSNLPMQEVNSWVATKADTILPEFIATQLPSGIAGLLLAALLAAAMSSLSSGMNSISTVLMRDFVQRFGLVQGYSELTLARIFSCITGACGIVTAIWVTQFMRSKDWNLVDLMERVNHLFVAPLGALFFAGVFFRHVGSLAVLVGFIMGALTSFAISFGREIFGTSQSVSFMWILPASFVVSMAAAYICGFFFPRPSQKQLEGMSLRPPPEKVAMDPES